MPRFDRRALWLIVLTGLAGCADGPLVVRVSGTVTRDGAPVPNLFLNFLPDQGRPSWGMTDAEGRYTLHYDRDQDGAVTGTHTVWVAFKPRDPGEEAAMHQGKLPMPQDLGTILKKYGSQETTPLRITIAREGQVVDLPLD